MDDMQGLGERGAVGDLDHDAIRHHRAVQRHHGIGIVGREQLRLRRAIAGFQHFAQRPNAEALFQISRLGQLWREHPVHQHQPAHAGDGMRFSAAAARFSAAASGSAASGNTSRISTRRSVYFHSSIRRAAGLRA